MKNTIKMLARIITLCTLLTACGKGGILGGNKNPRKEFNVPADLMTTEEYHAELQKLLAKEDLSVADDALIAEIEKLGNRLEDQIRYNTQDLTECTGTKYYVSNSGSDDNDGKTPETAFATLEKINSISVNKGDLVLFERGSTWRGILSTRSGVDYSAYGEGHKPLIMNSEDGKTGTWTLTETANVWEYSEKITAKDVGSIVFDFGTDKECYADKFDTKSKLKKDYQFVHMGSTANDRPINQKLYLYSTVDPNTAFETIDISLSGSNISLPNNADDIHINNIEFRYGGNPYWSNTGCTNITMSYCISSFAGGMYDNNNTRLGGGGGSWLKCDNLVFDHCFFYEQFDSGVTPQHVGTYGESDKEISVFKNFITKDCLFDKCEYTLEFFQSQTGTTEDRYENLYFGYNFCRNGGYGFGDKPSASAYVKSWGHENTCYDSVIEYNVFDRAAATSIEVKNKDQKGTGDRDKYLPTLKNNIYIQAEKKKFADLNSGTYKYTKEDIGKLNASGFDQGSVHFFCAPKED